MHRSALDMTALASLLGVALACSPRGKPAAQAEGLSLESLERAPQLVEAGVDADSGRTVYALSKLDGVIACPLSDAAAVARTAPEPTNLRDDAGREQGVWEDRGGHMDFIETYVAGQRHGAFFNVERGGLRVLGYSELADDEAAGLSVEFGEGDRPLDVGKRYGDSWVGWHCEFGPEGRLLRADAGPGTPGGAHTLDYDEDGQLREWAAHDAGNVHIFSASGALQARKTGPAWELYDEQGEVLVPAGFAPSGEVALEGLSAPKELSVDLLFTLDAAHTTFERAHRAFELRRPRISLESEICTTHAGVSVRKQQIEPKLELELRAQEVFVRMRETDEPCASPEVYRSPRDGEPLRAQVGLGSLSLTSYAHDHVNTSALELVSAHGRLRLEGLEHVEVFEADIDGVAGPELYVVESETCSTELTVLRIRQR